MGLMDKVTQMVNKDKHDTTTTHTAPYGTAVSSEHDQYANTPGSFPAGNTTGQGSHLAGASASHNTYNSNSGFGPNTGSHSNTTGLGSHSTTAGPHNSDALNKADPRVDSDQSRLHQSSGLGSSTTGNTGLGSHSNTTGVGSHPDTTGYGSHSNTGYGSNTSSNTAGPHNSNVLNKADPRVDSDQSRLHNSSGLGPNTGSTGLGSHSNTSGLGAHNNTTGLGSNTTTGYGSSHGVGSDHVNRDGYGSTTGATGQSTVGPHNSDMLNKLDPRVDSDASKTHQGQHGLTGTGHSSSQRDHNSGVQGFVPGSHGENPSAIPTAGGERVGDNVSGSSTSGYPSSHQQTTAGPHNSNVLNKADPRVDSDNSRLHDNHHGRDAGLAGTSVGAGAYANERSHHNQDTYGRTEPQHSSHKDHGLASHSTTNTHGTHSSSTHHDDTTGPVHKSGLLNKLDPRVKDEEKLRKEREHDQHYGRDGAIGGAGLAAGAYGAEHSHNKHSTHGTDSNFSRNEPYGTSSNITGNAPYTTAGPHNTFAANQLDPHVSGSDRSHATHSSSTTGTHGLGSSTHPSSTMADNTTAGPHKSDMLNKLDPRVDSDQSKLRDQQYGSTTGSTTGSRSGVEGISHGTSGLSLGSHKKKDYGYSAAHESAYDQGWKDALAHFESQRRN